MKPDSFRNIIDLKWYVENCVKLDFWKMFFSHVSLQITSKAITRPTTTGITTTGAHSPPRRSGWVCTPTVRPACGTGPHAISPTSGTSPWPSPTGAILSPLCRPPARPPANPVAPWLNPTTTTLAGHPKRVTRPIRTSARNSWRPHYWPPLRVPLPCPPLLRVRNDNHFVLFKLFN